MEPPNGDQLAGRGAAGVLGLHLHWIAVLCTTNPSTAFCTLHLKGNQVHKGGLISTRFSSSGRSPLHHGGCQTSKITMSSGSPQLRPRGGALTHRQIGHQGAWGFKGTKTEPDALTPQHQVPTWPLTKIQLSIAHIKLYYKPLTGHYLLNSTVAPGPSPSLQPDGFPSLYAPSMFQKAGFQFDSSNFDSYLWRCHMGTSVLDPNWSVLEFQLLVCFCPCPHI